VDNVVRVERHIERVMILKMVIDDGLLNVLTVYALHTGQEAQLSLRDVCRGHAS